MNSFHLLLLGWIVGGLVSFGIVVIMVDEKEALWWRWSVYISWFVMSWLGVGISIGRIWETLDETQIKRNVQNEEEVE